MNDFELRPMSPADLAFVVDLTVREGWAGSRAWFTTLIEHDPDLCWLGERDGRPVAMITATRFAATAWIGNLIVVPTARRRGLGEYLMRAMLDRLAASGVRTVRLEADPPGINIYRRLGFVEEGLSRRFRLEAGHVVAKPPGVRALAGRPDEISSLDLIAFGDDRSRLLTTLRRHSIADLRAPAEGPIGGYASLVSTAMGAMIGPCVAGDAGTAEALFRAALARCPGTTVTFGVLKRNRAAGALATALGFVETAPSVRMVRGAPIGDGDPSRVWAIGNGAVG